VVISPVPTIVPRNNPSCQVALGGTKRASVRTPANVRIVFFRRRGSMFVFSPALICFCVNPTAFIQSFPNIVGENQKNPRAIAAMVATRIAT